MFNFFRFKNKDELVVSLIKCRNSIKEDLKKELREELFEEIRKNWIKAIEETVWLDSNHTDRKILDFKKEIKNENEELKIQNEKLNIQMETLLRTICINKN